ncbi:hypothetical protein O181_059402 [Austropuccinia psidii MF-1]|uniref:Uncharacterized protein n=1 Tax=Austropuccinia psidii MF-1 TaxID=1389203 RepID=A0A9Q3HXE3_9BASI|nr:hypothetical protein [Austropuccinia psidii MF-1]
MSLPVFQQRNLVDKNSLAFFPDPTRSLFPPQNNDHNFLEKWSDWKLSKEFSNKTLKFYGLDEVEVDSEGEDVESGMIDLEVPIEGDKDGEWSRIYDEDEDKDYVQSSEEEG